MSPLNKINYVVPPNQLSKAAHEDGKALGRWKQYQTKFNKTFDPTKGYFVVLQPGEGAIDFDIITKDKLINDKKKKYFALPQPISQSIYDDALFLPPIEIVKDHLKYWGLPTEGYLIQTQTGGYHYYIRYPSTFPLHNTDGRIFVENLAIDFRSSGGLLYSVGTQWKDRPNSYIIYEGTEDSIPAIDPKAVWRLAGAIGMFNVYIGNINLGNFILGKIDPHSIPLHYEFVVWREAMYLLKELGYSGLEIQEIFAQLEGYKPDVCEAQIRAYWDKEDDPKRLKPSDLPFIIKPPEIELKPIEKKETEMYYTFDLTNSGIQVVLDDTGVYTLQEYKKNPIPLRKEIYSWTNFKVVGKIQSETSKMNVFVYDGVLNNQPFYNMSFGELRHLLRERAYVGEKGYNNIVDVLNQYLLTVPDISDQVSNCIGFFKDGWHLPPKKIFRFSEGGMKETLKSVESFMKIEVNATLAQKAFALLYNATNFKYKDLYFAHCAISPFYAALRERYHIMPSLYFYGSNNKGKSAALEINVKTFWDNKMGLITNDILEKKSQFLGILSGSTFPVMIDECEVITASLGADLRTHGASPVPFRRKEGQMYIVDANTYAPINGAYNNQPTFLQDPATRDRSIIMPFEIAEIVEGWDKIMDAIPNGLFGRMIVEKTKDWQGINLFTFFDSIEAPKGIKMGRTNKIWKYLVMGAKIIKECFNYDLNIDCFAPALHISKIVGVETLIDAIKHMIMKGCQCPFLPTDWVRQRTLSKRYKNEWGVVIDSQRKTELYTQYEDLMSAKRKGLASLYEVLKGIWEDVYYGPISLEGTLDRRLWIPTRHIIGVDHEIYEYLSLSTTDQEIEQVLEREKGVFQETETKQPLEEELDAFLEGKL